MALDINSITSRLRAAGCVFAEDEARLLLESPRSANEIEAMVARRSAGTPLEYILGWAEFCGLRITVSPGVFVPRRRSEFLVQQAAAMAPPRPVVVDLCCGSGAIGAALAAALDDIELHSADVDPVAVQCARRNVAAAGGHAYLGDLFESLPHALRERVDVLVANTPYVPTDEIALMPPEAREHEPRVALAGGADGLDIQRRVAAQAPGWIAPGGHLLIETSDRQAAQLVGILGENGLDARIATSDDLHSTIVIATMANDTSGKRVPNSYTV